MCQCPISSPLSSLVHARAGTMVAMSDASGRAKGRPGPGMTLFAWVKQELREAIARGQFRPDEPFITQREIVERFGVSTTTAVRALNDLVAEGLVVRRRGRGTFVAERPPVESVIAAGERMVALVCDDNHQPHLAQLMAGLTAEGAALGYRLVVAHSGGDQDEEEVIRRVAGSGVQGLILFPRDRSTAAQTVEEVRRAGTAVVVVDRYFPAMPTDAVVFDDFAIGYQVTAAILDRGHTGVAALWSEDDVTSVRDRLSGHRRALHDRGLPELPERSALRIYTALPPVERRSRIRGWLDSDAGLTAVICGNAITLAVVVSDLLALERGFPGSVELASMDEAGPYGVLPLAAVSAGLPAREMGRVAMRMLLERIEGSTEPFRHNVLPATVHTAGHGQKALGVIGADCTGAHSAAPTLGHRAPAQP
jgi:GntR family transcriptional regulator, arabinose operon transcriptional repressor